MPNTTTVTPVRQARPNAGRPYPAGSATGPAADNSAADTFDGGNRMPRRNAPARMWGPDVATAGDGTGRLPMLRLPGPHDPAPDTRRMIGICAWAAALGLIGLAVAGRALVALATATPPGWYEPTVVPVGLLGMALTATAYLAVQHARLPWLLLGAATVPLVANLAVTIAAL